MAAITAEGLVKIYGSGHKEVRALDGVDLEVPEGTVLGLLGPNGAGKTTAVRVLTTLLKPDAGRATVLGVDVAKHPRQVRERIGLSGQYAAVDDNLTGRENLVMVGRLYHLGKRSSQERAQELLEQFALTDAADRPAKTYSGGMRRRLDLAAALVVRPPVMFLDEPTTGLDPRTRFAMWDVIAELVKGGATLLLTTQYLEEADRLADSIAVVDHGKVIARGTADELKSQVGGERLQVVIHDRGQLGEAAALLERLAGAPPQVDERTRELLVPVSGGARFLVEAIRELDAAAIGIDDIALRRPTLDDVFLSLTGRAAEEGAFEEEAEPVALGGKAGR
jgi:ABC-2 type transport system ATP-binding protein